MRTRILTTGLLLLAVTACSKDKAAAPAPVGPGRLVHLVNVVDEDACELRRLRRLRQRETRQALKRRERRRSKKQQAPRDGHWTFDFHLFCVA